MKNSTKNILLILVLCVASFILGIIAKKYGSPKKMNPLPSYENTLVLINQKDSVEHQIDTIYINLNKVNGDYKKAIDSVINLDDSASVCFFLEYTGKYRERYDSIN